MKKNILLALTISGFIVLSLIFKISDRTASAKDSQELTQKANKLILLKTPLKIKPIEKKESPVNNYTASTQELKEYDSIINMISKNEKFEPFLDKFEKKYPESSNIELLYYQVIYHYYYYNPANNIEKWCKKYFDKFPQGIYYSSIISFYNGYKNIYLEIYTYSAFLPSEDASIYLNANNTGTVDIEIYAVDTAKIDLPLNRIDPYDFPLTKETLVKKISKEFTEKNFYGSLSLGKLKAGLYVVAARTKDITSACILCVSQLGVITKSDPDKTLLFVMNKITGEPVKESEIKVFQNEYLVAKGLSDKEGIAIFEKKEAQNYRYYNFVVSKNNDIAFVDVYQYRGHEQKILKSYFYPDRPVYRPEQTVNFKIILREKLDTISFAVPSDKQYKVVIQTPSAKKIYEKTLAINEFGSINDSVKLEPKAELGWYTFFIYNSSGVQVSEYSSRAFSVEEYKKPEFKMSITPVKMAYIKGETAEVNVDVKYYFGQPVKDGIVEYRIEYGQYYIPYWYYYPFAWYYDYDENYYSRGHEFYLEGKAVTGEDGKCKIKFDTKDLPYNANYTVNVRVTDKSRRMIEGSASIRAAIAGFTIDLTTDKYVYKPGENVLVQFSGKDINDKPYAFNGEILITKYEWKKGKDAYKEVLKQKIKTEPNGKGFYKFIPDEQGNFYIKITAKDRQGRTITAERTVYAADYSYHSFYNYSGINLVFNKDYYDIGDQATVVLQSPYKEGYGLITYEAEGLMGYKVIKLASSTTVMDFPILDNYAPNFFYSVTIIKDNKINSQSKNIIVLPRDKFLNIKIQSKKEIFHPGEEAVFMIKVTDKDNNPVSCELSLGMVDASLYYIQEEFVQDIQQFFYSRVWNYVTTGNSFYSYSYGKKKYARKDDSGGAMKSMSADEDRAMESEKKEASAPSLLAKVQQQKTAEKEPEIREYFPDTAFWSPAFQTDKNGEIIVKIKMPDTLTTWRSTVRAITKDTRVGSIKHESITFKNLLARLELPRFITQDDQLVISGIVHNYLKSDKDVRSELNASGVTLSGEKSQTSKINSGKDFRFDWKVKAEKPGTAEFILKALTDEESDAMKLKIPVLAHGLLRHNVQSGIIKNDNEKTLNTVTVPVTAIMGSSQLEVLISGSIASAMFDSLDYLIGYPYGCVEQTMSRFLPDIIVSQSIQKLQLEKPEILKKLPDMVEKGLARLYELQHGDGGWGWWTNDETHDYMTAYVIYGLTLARLSDYKVREDVYSRGLNALKELFKKEKPNDTKAYMAYTLSYLKDPDKKGIIELYKNSKSLTIYGKSLLAMALIKINEKEKAGALIKEIKAQAEPSENFCSFHGEVFHYSWERNDIEVTAYVLKALAMFNTDDALIPKIINWLLTKRTQNYWVSTKDTANVIYAFAEYLDRTGELKADYNVTVKVNGKEVINTDINAKNILNSKGRTFIPAESLIKGDNTVEIIKNGKGRLYSTLSLNYFNYEKEIKPESKNIKIKRSYEIVTKIKDKEGKVIKEELKPLEEVIHSGEEIEVTLTVDASSPLEYIMIEDYIPAGCEILDRKSENNWWTHQEFRDEKAVFFITRYYYYGKKDTQTIKYRLRAEIPGDYEILPSLATSMYFPEVYANTKSDKLTILERSESKK